jgi:GntR family transcriptional regulator/MocR family aminotransferase
VDIHISLDGVGDRTDRIYRQLADAIIDGRLRPGDPLPASRALAASLRVARNTVVAAYDRLLAEGLTATRVGAGTFVSPTVDRARVPRRRPSALQPRPWWRDSEEGPDDPPDMQTAARFDFQVGVPDARLFPQDVWRRTLSHLLRPTARLPATYADPAGVEILRAALARHVALSRAVVCTADDVVVTSGAQQGLSLIARVLLRPGDTVAVEDPGYPPVREMFASFGADVVGVPVDASGIRVEALPDSATVVYCTPSHQFPLGMAMTPERRIELLEWASRHRAAVIEDDYDSEFRFGQRPLDSLYSLDRAGRVIYVGTFSKSLHPVIRMGFVVGPPSLQEALVAAKRLDDVHSDLVTQLALAALLDTGTFATHVRRAKRAYARRHALLSSRLVRDFDGVLDVVPSSAGLHLAAWLDPRTRKSSAKIVQDAALQGIRLQTIERFYRAAPTRSGLVLGFGGVDERGIAEGLTLLRRIIR